MRATVRADPIRHCNVLPAAEDDATHCGQGADRELPGISRAIRRLRSSVTRIAGYDTSVLLVGESGSGKEYVAQALHRLSKRSSKPLVVLNCAALPESLVESDLFGYERGAFTNAHSAYPGKFALADGGTLFLDEIGDMPRAVQAKILRVVEGREYYRIGARHPDRANVRLIAATHRDLDTMCESGEFRRDLYFRLNVARIDLPPLRERMGDIDVLARLFMGELRVAMGRPRLVLGDDVHNAMQAYGWPGNVRELRNAMESAIIHAEGETIGVTDLPSHIVRWLERSAAPADERTRLESALRETRWNKSEAARTLSWSRVKLYRKLRQYGLADCNA